MAVIDKKLIHFTNLATFEQRLDAGDIKDTSIVFIQDAKRIWTHGQYYSSPYTKEEIDQLFVGSNVTLDGYSGNGIVEIISTDTVNEAFGKVEEYLASLSDLNAVLVDTGDLAEDPIYNDYISSTELNRALELYATDDRIDELEYRLNNGSFNKEEIIISDIEPIADTDIWIDTAEDAVEESGFATREDVINKQDVISDLNTIRSGASLGATSVQPSDIVDMETKTNAAQTYATKAESLITNGTVTNIVSLSQAEYDELSYKNPTTLYIVTD